MLGPAPASNLRAMSRFVVVVLTLLTIATPSFALDLVPRDATTTTVTVTRHRRWGMFSGGLVLFTTGYVVDVGASYGIGNPKASHSAIPLVGPLVQMGDSWGLKQSAPSTGNAQIDQQVNAQVTQVNSQLQTA